MIVESYTIQLETTGNDQILDVTRPVVDAVRGSGIAVGQAVAMVTGSTGALSTLEYEPGLVNHDIASALEKLAPRDGEYEHEKTWHDDNGHSHVRACLIGPSIAMPIVSGDLPLGTWQQIVLLDFDTRPRRRTITLSVVGAPS